MNLDHKFLFSFFSHPVGVVHSPLEVSVEHVHPPGEV